MAHQLLSCSVKFYLALLVSRFQRRDAVRLLDRLQTYTAQGQSHHLSSMMAL